MQGRRIEHFFGVCAFRLLNPFSLWRLYAGSVLGSLRYVLDIVLFGVAFLLPAVDVKYYNANAATSPQKSQRP